MFAGRFKNPQPLPDEYKYEDKDYIYENSCGLHSLRTCQ